MFDFSTMLASNNAPAEISAKPLPAQEQEATPTRPRLARVSTADLAAFKAGFAWLWPRLPDLAKAGWTRPELFRRNRARRGVAWLALWTDKDVTADLTAEGFIRFTIARHNRTCTQTARPMAWHLALQASTKGE